MSAIRLASRYAKSLIDLAHEKGKLEPVLNDMKLFKKMLKENREFLVMLKSPIILGDKKVGVIDKAFRGSIDELTYEFIKILINKGREGHFPIIATVFIEQYNKRMNISPVLLTTSVELEESVKLQIVDSLHTDKTVGEVQLDTEVNEDLIGGFILKYQDKLFDASVIRSLNELRHNVEDSTYQSKL